MTEDKKFFDSKEFKDLLNKYELSVKTGNPIYLEPEELTYIGEYYQEQGLTEKAIKVLDYAIQVFPGAINPLLLRSRIALIDDQDIEKAKQYADQIEDKSDLDYYYLIAEIMLVEEKVEEAEIYLENKFNYLEDEYREDFAIDVSNLYLDYRYAKKAERWFSFIEAKKSIDALEIEGRIAKLKNKFRKSEKIYKELVEREPYSLDYWNQLTSLQFMNGKIKDSIQSSEFAIAINPNDSEANMNKANGLFSLNNFEEALKYYNKFSELEPYNISGEIFQGAILLNLNRTKEAITHLLKGEQLAGDDPISLGHIYRQLAFSYAKSGEMEYSVDYIDKLAELEGIDIDNTNIIKGGHFLISKKPEEAVIYFYKAIDHSKENSKILQSIGLICFDNEYYEICYNILLKLFDVVPKKWKSDYSYMAKCCKYLEHKEEYLKYLKIACEKNLQEVASVFADELPKNITPKEFYNYLKSKE